MRDFGRRMQDYAARQARVMRGRAHEAAAKRKEQYLGARVPKELRNRVIARARSMGIPVSILIRNILEESFRGDVASPGASTTAETAATGSESLFPGVIGWKDIVLNKRIHCSKCRKVLVPRTPVTLGLGAQGEDHVILCEECSESI